MHDSPTTTETCNALRRESGTAPPFTPRRSSLPRERLQRYGPSGDVPRA
jgi:hypothetical protein